MTTADQRRQMRECRLFLESDLFERVKSPDPDRSIAWRSPGGFKVVLTYGERVVTGHVENPDGSLRGATGYASAEWLDEVTP